MKAAFISTMKRPRILIVEDDESIRDLCRDLLEEEGYVVETCVNGRDAIASLDRNQDPCLIFLDMMMPIMNGREFMAEFVKRPHAIAIAPIPVFLVSATASSGAGKEMGCSGFLKKPFAIDALLSIARACCSAKETEMESAA